MNVQQQLQIVSGQLGPDGDRLGAEVLLAFVLGKDRTFLVSRLDFEVPAESEERFMRLFMRLMQGEPVAYLTGIKEFFGLEFHVDKSVLIPRPETEHMVERVIEYCRSHKVKNVLDVGTGSGCIAVSVAKNIPEVFVGAVDVSEDALKVAETNASKHHVKNRVKFWKSDLLEEVGEPHDVIAANLPYIGEKRFSFVSRSAVDYEPHVALFGGEDGLGLYAKMFDQLKQKSWRPKIVVGEFGFLQREAMESLLISSFPGDRYEFVQDYAHIDRMFVVEFDSGTP